LFFSRVTLAREITYRRGRMTHSSMTDTNLNTAR
jgi:hypothetical protein